MKPLIGEPIVRQEDARLLRGQGRFVDDVHVDGMLHAALFRSSWPHGRIRTIDVAAAAALPGVVGVFTLPDFSCFLEADPIAHCGDARALKSSCNCRSPPTRSAMSANRWPCGRDQSVRRRGRAVSLISAEIEDLPPVLSWDRAAKGATLIHETAGTNHSSIKVGRGDAETAFQTAPYVRRETFRVQRHTAVPMETRGLVAVWDQGQAA